jgi:hypothetical protein
MQASVPDAARLWRDCMTAAICTAPPAHRAPLDAGCIGIVFHIA